MPGLGRAVARSDHDIAVLILAEAQDGGSLLTRLRARRGQQHQRASGHLTAELPAVGPELLDQLLIERFDIGRNLWRWSSLWRLIWAHEFSKQLIGIRKLVPARGFEPGTN